MVELVVDQEHVVQPIETNQPMVFSFNYQSSPWMWLKINLRNVCIQHDILL